MSTTKEYKAIKNFIHNELKLDKESIIKLYKKAIIDEAKAHVARVFQQNGDNLITLTKEEIKKEVIRNISGHTYNSDRTRFYQSLGEEIAKNMNISFKK